jgi:hypothetical protein
MKSFWPLLLESTCAFIIRAGSRTLSTWNSCVCHPCISFLVKPPLFICWFIFRLGNPSPGKQDHSH